MRSKLTWLVTIVAALVGASLGAAQGFGSPDGSHSYTTYAGAKCVRWSGATASYKAGMVHNQSVSSNLWIDCPATYKRNVADSYHATSLLWAIDRHTSQTIECVFAVAFYTHDGDDNQTFTTFVGSADASAGGSGVAQLLQSDLPEHAGNGWAGHAYVSCKVPPRLNEETASSSISNYQTDN
jgi:hypothetical protein